MHTDNQGHERNAEDGSNAIREKKENRLTAAATTEQSVTASELVGILRERN